ncbi:hypothetical protein CUMW_281590, partial [Citrus unshiu]
MSRPHVLVMPAPAQGHIIPLLEFSQCLANHGIRVTFVITDYDHKRVVESLEGKNDLVEQTHLVSIPDGMEPWEDRNDLGKLIEKVLQVMPGKLEELIEEINSREDEKLDCFIADGYMAWSMEVAKKMNVRGALFWPSSAASVALLFHIPKLIDDGIIDSHVMLVEPWLLAFHEDSEKGSPVPEKKMNRPHVLVMPASAQGHVIPLLEFSQCLAKHGFRVTFVNTDYDHKRVVESLEGKNDLGEQIRLVSIPDGMEPWEDRNDLGKLTEKVLQVMPGKLAELIEEINSREDEKLDCFIADGYMAWSMEVAKKMNVRGALFWPSSAASVALLFHIPKLIDDGIIDSHGTPMSKQMFRIAPNMPEMNAGDCFWTDMGDLTTERILFDLADKDLKAMRAVKFQLCHSTYELEAGAFTVVPELLPIGPLLASNRLGNTAGHFWREDS